MELLLLLLMIQDKKKFLAQIFIQTGFLCLGFSIAVANVDVKRDIVSKSTAQSSSNESQQFQIPPGTILAFAGAIIPNDWLKADGSTISQQQYPALFQVICDSYGTEDQVNTFDLPDLRGRVIVGAGKGIGLTNRLLGNHFGSEQHVLTQNEMPVHTHPVNDPGHIHDMRSLRHSQVCGVRPNNVQYCYGVDNGGVTNNPPTLQAQTGVNIQSVGGGAPHNNVQPSIAINYIIKY
jgi:microcystin-dependent protein